MLAFSLSVNFKESPLFGIARRGGIESFDFILDLTCFQKTLGLSFGSLANYFFNATFFVDHLVFNFIAHGIVPFTTFRCQLWGEDLAERRDFIQRQRFLLDQITNGFF